MTEAISRWQEEYENNISLDPLHYERSRYVRALNDRNDLSYWFNQIKGCGFRLPETKIIQMPLQLFSDLNHQLDGISPDFMKRLGAFIEASWDLVPGNLDINGKLFFRFGTSSGKFCMETNCIVYSKEEIPLRVCNTLYENECMGKPESVFLVFREFIETEADRPSIYYGLKLNTEFRIFYDFDEHRFIQGFNYWGDHDAMTTHMNEDQRGSYEEAYPMLSQEYERLLPMLKTECEEKLKDIHLKGKWSVDFMWTGKEFVLIDMALARNSYFADRLPEEERTDRG